MAGPHQFEMKLATQGWGASWGSDTDIRSLFPAQTWITPDRRGHAPQYGSAQFAPADRRNRLLHILGGTGDTPAWAAPSGSGIRLHQARPACNPKPFTLAYCPWRHGRRARLRQARTCHAWVGVGMEPGV